MEYHVAIKAKEIVNQIEFLKEQKRQFMSAGRIVIEIFDERKANVCSRIDTFSQSTDYVDYIVEGINRRIKALENELYNL